MQQVQIRNRLRIIKYTYEAGFTHLGSCLSAVDIIEAIFQVKKGGEKFILSAGHAALALYAVLEEHGYLKKPNIKTLGVHPNRNSDIGIDVSSGSLGCGLPIAIGISLANKKRKVYCCISDGECAEGSISEAIRVAAENQLNNLVVVINANGYAAYRKTNLKLIENEFKAFRWKVKRINGHDLEIIKKSLKIKSKSPEVVIAKTKVNQLPFLKGIGAHYYKMTENDYKYALKKWSKD